MIYPTVSEILRCVNQTLLDASDETMPRMAVKSALATCRHLIRHAELRVQLEKSILLDDIDQAGKLLDRLAAYLDSGSSDRDGLGRVIRLVLADAPQLQSAAPGEAGLILQRAKALRELVYSALKHLQSADVAEKSTGAYQEARRLLRDYMKYQIEQEARMVTPAFLGHGPRR